MHKFITSRIWRVSAAAILLFTLLGMTVSAQEPEPQTFEAFSAEMGAPTFQELEYSAEPPTLTEEQEAKLAYWAEHTHLPGPVLGERDLQTVGPVPGTESVLGQERVRSGQPLAPGDATLFLGKEFGQIIPPGYNSNVMESSVGIAGKYIFFTGNWFAAYSDKGGDKVIYWNYVNPYADMADFCCDQVVIYDEARGIYLWLRMGVPDWVGGNYENRFRLSVTDWSFKNPLVWWHYDTRPLDVNAGWTNEFWDYPHIQLGADYVYIAWNLFDNLGNWTRTVMLRWPLDALAAGTGFTYNYYWTQEWFTFVPVQGAYHMMYWASNWPSTLPQTGRLMIWGWQEDEATGWFVEKQVAEWRPTGKGDAHCPLSGTYNWLARTDQRVLTGARYSINSPGVVDPKWLGRKILGWWWNVGEDPVNGFPYPYIDGAAFFEDTLNQVPGWLGRPYIWGSSYCFAYPSITPNKRQDLGAVFNYAEEPQWRPNVAYAMADDYIHAPPGWTFYTVRKSRSLPADNVWGDYNTVREFEPTQKIWVGGAHRIPEGMPIPGCVNCSVPIYMVFGRERDYWSWRRWWRR
jgi:hypothetical protein